MNETDAIANMTGRARAGGALIVAAGLLYQFRRELIDNVLVATGPTQGFELAEVAEVLGLPLEVLSNVLYL